MLSRFLSSRGDLTRGDDPFATIQRELGRAVEDAFRGVPALRSTFAGGFAPSLDVKETPEGLELTAELPGVKEEDIDLSLDGEVLTLRGEKREEKTSQERGMHMQERSYGSFQRSLRLPYAPDPGSVTANFDKGVLHVMLPRPQQGETRTNRIQIQSSSGQQQTQAGPSAQGSGNP